MALYFGKKLISRNSSVHYQASTFPLVGVLDGLISSISIPSYVEPDDVWKITKNRNELTSVTFPKNHLAIGDYALYATSVTSVDIPSGAVRLGKYSLAETLLQTITIPSSIVILETGCLSGTTQLQTIQFAEGCNIRSLPSEFLAYSSVTSITIPRTVNSIASDAFWGSELTTIRIKRREGSISGAPWGATRATIIWEG